MTTGLLVLSILSSSFLGSWHCTAMCSPIASLMASRKSLWPYHLGRGTSYIALGMIAGWLGQFFLSSSFVWLRTVSAILLALTLFYSGLSLAKPDQFQKWKRASSWLHHIIYHLHGKSSFSVTRSGYVVGLLTALLPCGWLYTYVTASIATQTAWGGALVMALFWFGGLPALSAVPWMMKSLIQAAPMQRQRMAGYVLMAAGLYTLGSFFFLHS